MPLYSMSQLIDKSLVLAKNMNIYLAGDIVRLGTAGAKPAYVMQKGDSFTVDSYLLSGAAGKDQYGLSYAARKYNYFLFYRGSQYYAIAIIDGAYSRKDMQSEGILTVKEEADKAAAEDKTIFDKIADSTKNIFADAGKVIKIVVALAILYLIIAYILPALKDLKKK